MCKVKVDFIFISITCRDRFRTFTNVLGDSLGAGIVHHMSRHELAAMPAGPMSGGGNNEPDIEMDGPLGGGIDLEKGESSNGGLGPASSTQAGAGGAQAGKNPTTSVDVEWQSTSM